MKSSGGGGVVVACLIIVSTPGPGFFKVNARFGLPRLCQFGDQVDQVMDQVGQGQGQELDNTCICTHVLFCVSQFPYPHLYERKQFNFSVFILKG